MGAGTDSERHWPLQVDWALWQPRMVSMEVINLHDDELLRSLGALLSRGLAVSSDGRDLLAASA